jgi:hypothetical protein
MFAISSFAQEEENKPVDIVNIVCDQKGGRFILKYVHSNDDFFSQPIVPKSCNLNHSKYKVTGERGPFSQSTCGAEPPVSIDLTRNGISIITDAVLGGNCFHGPSIAEVEITERKGRIDSIKLCMFRSGESPVTEKNMFEPVCKSFRGSSEIKKVLPINQSKLNDYTSEIRR